MERKDVIRRLMATFVDEVDDHVRRLNRDLLDLERSKGGGADASTLRSLLRTAHTLKGAAASVGVGLLRDAGHCLEEVFLDQGEGRGPPVPLCFETLFQVVDGVQDAGRRLRAREDPEAGPLAGILEKLRRSSAAGRAAGRTAAGCAAGRTPRPPSGPRPATERIIRKALPTFLAELEDDVRQLNRRLLELEREKDPSRRAAVLRSLMATAHNIKGASGLFGFDLLAEACHRVEDVLAAVLDGRLPARTELLQLLFDTADALQDAGRRLARSETLDGAPIAGFAARLAALVERPMPAAAGRPVPLPEQGRPGRRDDADAGLVRVDPGKLDALAARVLELRTSLSSAQDRVGSLDELAAAVERLDEEVRRIRKFPFAEACQGLARVVRDLSTRRRKAVDLVIRGGKLDLDRSVLQGLKAPLLHLIRNAVAHGVEPAEERRRLGKPPRARIVVEAAPARGGVEVCVRDDGRGFDLAAIRASAARRGMEPPDDDEALLELVLLPGFTTTGEVDDVSGRGVGMDVVRSHVEALGGRVRLRSRPGKGAAVVLALPPGKRRRQAVEPNGATGRSPGVLVVDDARTMRDVQRILFEEAGYRVRTAADGDEAWAILGAEPVDLVVTDIEMPGMDGFDLTRAIRGSDAFAELPVVMWTARTGEDSRTRGLACGASAYVVKGRVPTARLLEIVRELLQ